jgi:hypothetical protein
VRSSSRAPSLLFSQAILTSDNLASLKFAMFILIAFTLLFGLSQALVCNSDNCLNAFVHTSSLAKPFCSTYTKLPETATYVLPNYATACGGIPSRVSSACSCLNTASSTTHASTTPTTITRTSSVSSMSLPVLRILQAPRSYRNVFTASGSEKFTLQLQRQVLVFKML